MGRTAKLEPGCKPEEAVFFGMRDHILAYIADRRHSEDSLFLVFEEDWRLSKADCDVFC